MFVTFKRIIFVSHLTDLRIFAVLWILMFSGVCLSAEENTNEDAQNLFEEPNPWSFNLNLYLWLTGIDGDFSANRINRSVDKNFIDIVDASDRFPLGFMGRGEVHYKRFGLYVDGVWMDVDLKPKAGPKGFANAALEAELGIMDYGVIYRLFGSPDLASWKSDSKETFRLDFYAGGRTVWLENTLTPQRLPSVTASKSFTVPLIGGRIFIDLSRDWFVKIDGNAGGFGVDTVDFTGGVLGSMGYRADLFDVPLAIELGYKALFVDVSDKSVATDATLHGPMLGVNAYWK